MVDGAHSDTADAVVLRPLVHTGKAFYAVVAVLLAVMAWSVLAWIVQLDVGLSVTGLDRPVYWGLYITNFVFFIGISHAGTLISAILRVCQAEWRRPITRAAEVITVLALVIGASNIIVDLGRPERALYVIWYGKLQSPLLWDVLSISLYMAASMLYLYLPLIPDLALVRDHLPQRRWLYRCLALGWQGTPRQQRALHRAITIMAILVIPIAILVHTVVAWVFAMTVQPMWHSTIFGPYFVVGAIFSGIAALIIVMAIIRKAYALEDYLKPVHFNYLGLLLLVMSLLWFYFTIAEYLTTYYGNAPVEMAVFWAKLTGPYAPYFWTMAVANFVVPFGILANRCTRSVTGTVVASSAVLVGMWLERFTIVVPTLVNPRLPMQVRLYQPTWVEWSLMAGNVATFALMYMLFAKFFPIVSLWEIQEGRTHGLQATLQRLQTYLPGHQTEARS